MDFLSETAKKEKRNLLASGFAGLIVARLKIYPTDIELAGLKFHSPELPFIAIVGLCVAITYFLIKFWSSYLYERSAATIESLATQIRRGKTAMDIAQVEESLIQKSRDSILQRQGLKSRQEDEDRRMQTLQDIIDQEDLSHEATLKGMKKKKLDLDQALATEDQSLALKYIGLPRHLRNRSIQWETMQSIIQNEIKTLEEVQADHIVNRESQRQLDIGNLTKEKKVWKEEFEGGVKMQEREEHELEDKRNAIAEWKRTHTMIDIVSPFHQFLEVYMPTVVAVIAVVSLIYLMFHFPLPAPLSIPEF